MEFEKVLSGILEVKKPWFVREIDVHKGTKSVNVFIDYEDRTTFKCPNCEQECKVHDSRYRVWRHLNIMDYRCYLNVKVPRIKCDKHKVLVIGEIPWGRMNIHFTHLFEQEVMKLCQEMSVSAVAKQLEEVDTTLWNIFHYQIAKVKEKQLNFSEVKRICVDETASKRGHNYVTIFSDADSGDVLFVTEGKTQESFALLYSELFNHMGDPNYIKQFIMDMSKSYKAGWSQYFSHTEIIFDRFHIKMGLNKSIDKVRRSEVWHVEKLKKTKYLWLKNECDLNDVETIMLKEFMEDCNYNTVKAYSLKAGFDQLWNVQPKAVEPLLEAWINKAKNTYLVPIKTFINTIKNNYNGVINSMKTGLTNATAEGINSIIQLTKSRARGFRNVNNFISMIYMLGNDFKFNYSTK
ncbi:ISL3-like element ISMac21 family transposase [soil metagenome]